MILGVTIIANGNLYDAFSNNSKDINYILYHGKDKNNTDYFNQSIKNIVVTYYTLND